MFDKLIGQTAIKSKLEFYAKGHQNTSTTPFLMFNGAKGLGKTHFARTFSKNLKQAGKDKRKPFVEVNCATIGSFKQFIEEFYLQNIVGREVTLLFDEAHELPKKLAQAFLTVLNTEKETKRWLKTADGEVPFDFKELTFLFATTELDRLFAPLKERLKRIDFAPYTEEELGEILKMNIDDVDFDEIVVPDISATLRGNARDAVQMAHDIDIYCENHNTNKFGKSDWDALRDILQIHPLGVNETELQVLRLLRERGECSLQEISNFTGMSRRAIQREAENYPLARGLMKIDGQRKITDKGRKLLDEVGDAK
jgi:Holliday junction resolvasome RuvABC ATP-dependent DNA helicase subunit